MHQYIYLCPHDFQCHLKPVFILTWKHEFLCATVFVCWSCNFCSHTLFRMCTCISTCLSVHMTPHECPCVAVCVCPSHPASGHTPWLACIQASVHVYTSTWLPMSVHPLCIVWWKHGCACVALCVCHIHPTSSHTLWLDCVHVSVHEFISTWLPMSAPPPMHSLMETWMPLYGSVFVSQSPHFCSHTLFRMCTCISTCIYVHLTPMLAKPPMDIYMAMWVPMCGTVCPSHPAYGSTP